MDTLSIILVAACAVLLIALVAVTLILQGRHSREKVAMTEDFHRKRDELVRDYEAQKDALQEKITESESKASGLQAAISSRETYEQQMALQREKEEEKREERHKAELESMKTAFAALSAQNSDTFKQRSSETIEDLLKPVREKFDEFTRSVKESQKESSDRHSRLEQKIEDLEKRSLDVSHDAKTLADAISGYSKVQGDFGEMLLVDILKSAGLTEGIHFKSQGVITDSLGREVKSEEGKKMIPDVLIFYPDNTLVVVDSKMSLNAYMGYVKAQTPEERVRFAKANTESVRKHVEELKGKAYNEYIPQGRRKVDFNIMFVPSEGAFRLMLEDAPELWQQARRSNVLIVSQMTLMVVLNMIQMSWRQKEQEDNIAAVYKTAGELMKYISDWMENFEKVGSSLDAAQKAYAQATSKLSGGSRSVVRKIRDLEKMGISPLRQTKKIKSSSQKGDSLSVVPQSLLPQSDEYENTDIYEENTDTFGGAASS